MYCPCLKAFLIIQDNITPVYIAAQHGHVSALQVLLYAGADLSTRDVIEWSPLMVAAWAGQTEVVLFLSMSLSCISIKLSAQAVALLLSCGADPNDVSAAAFEDVPAGSTPLAVALLKGHTSVAALLQ